MSKKNFASSPKPKLSNKEISAFEKQGAGHDTQTHISTLPQSNKPTKRLSIDIDEDLHRKFKSICGLDGKTMKEYILLFIENKCS